MHSTTHNTPSLPQFLNPFIGPVSKYLIVPVVAIYVLWTTALHVGVISQIGYATGYGHFRGILSITPQISLEAPVGSLVFYASKGDKVLVDYKLHDGADGSLLFALSRISSLAFENSDFEDVFGKPEGTVKLDVNTSGFYMLRITPTGVAKNGSKSGYDLSWSASWQLNRR